MNCTLIICHINKNKFRLTQHGLASTPGSSLCCALEPAAALHTGVVLGPAPFYAHFTFDTSERECGNNIRNVFVCM